MTYLSLTAAHEVETAVRFAFCMLAFWAMRSRKVHDAVALWLIVIWLLCEQVTPYG